MATNTERLDQHQKDIAGILVDLAGQREVIQGAKDGVANSVARVEESLKRLQAELGDTRTAVARQDERIKGLEKHADHPAALSAHDQRLKALEKGTDRIWQLLPVAVSVVALLTAAYVAFVKK